MRTKLLIMLALLGVSSVTATAAESPVSGASASGGASTRLNELFEDYFERSLELNPLQATFIGDHRYDDRLTNNLSRRTSPSSWRVDREALAAAQKFDPKSLSRPPTG